MVIERKDLYEYLSKICKGKYSIGLHGIDLSRCKEINKYKGTKSDEELIEEVSNQIINKGLKVYSNRSINGTVCFFGRLDSSKHLESVFNGLAYYQYCEAKEFIIVATPVEYKNSNGEKIYVGSTNLDGKYKGYLETTGGEVSTILDYTILDNGILNNCFILGKFKVLDQHKIDLTINEQHICFNNDILPDELFENYKNKIMYILFQINCILNDSSIDINSLSTENLTMLNSLKEKYESGKFQKLIPNYAYFLETILQLINEINITNLNEDDIEKLNDLKKEFEECIIKYNEYQGARKNYLELLKNNSLEEICKFALSTPTRFKYYPLEIRDNIEIMRQVVLTKDLHPILLCYVGTNVRNDLEFFINLINNCDDRKFDFYKSAFGDNSNLVYDYCIGFDVLCNPIFWQTLNNRIQEINKKNNINLPLFDVEKELNLANTKRMEEENNKKLK